MQGGQVSPCNDGLVSEHLSSVVVDPSLPVQVAVRVFCWPHVSSVHSDQTPGTNEYVTSAAHGGQTSPSADGLVSLHFESSALEPSLPLQVMTRVVFFPHVAAVQVENSPVEKEYVT